MSFAVKLILILVIFGAFAAFLTYSQRKANRSVGQCTALVVRCPSCGNWKKRIPCCAFSGMNG